MLYDRLSIATEMLQIGKTNPIDARRVSAGPSAPHETRYVKQ